MRSEKPRLLYSAEIRRGRFFKRFLKSLLIVLASAGAYVALDEAARRGGLADSLLLDIGRLAAVVLGALMAVRGMLNFLRTLIRPSESVKFFDQGVVWMRGRKQHKYPWHQVVSYREGGRWIYLGKFRLFQFGANTLKMDDGKTFRFTGRFGEMRPCAEAVRRYAAYVTGVRIGRTLRGNEPVKLHKHLTVYPGGIEAGKEEIPWAELYVRQEGGTLVVRRKNDKGRYRVVRRYPVHAVDNVGGFLDLAVETIRNNQPERFKRPVARQEAAGFTESAASASA